jgi:hypothetical protein
MSKVEGATVRQETQLPDWCLPIKRGLPLPVGGWFESLFQLFTARVVATTYLPRPYCSILKADFQLYCNQSREIEHGDDIGHFWTWIVFAEHDRV